MAKLFCKAEFVSDFISTFCIAMIGTQSGIIVFVTGLKHSYFLKLYSKKGYMIDFLFFYFFTMICLFVTHTVATFCLSSLQLFNLMFALMIVNIFQFIFMLIICYNLAAKNENEIKKS
jgi:hypothetical protein